MDCGKPKVNMGSTLWEDRSPENDLDILGQGHVFSGNVSKYSSSIFSFIDGHFLIAILGRTSQCKGVVSASRLLFGWQRYESHKDRTSGKCQDLVLDPQACGLIGFGKMLKMFS